MDTWKFYDITHRNHLICNPTNKEKLNHLVELLHLPPQTQVVDIACGKGEFLIRLAGSYDIHGTGVEISPFHIAKAENRYSAMATNSQIIFKQMDGADFKPEKPQSLDVASCIGASWIFGGQSKTLETLKSWVKPGGWVIVGEPFWRKEPLPEYIEALGCAKEDFSSHSSNAEAGERLGLELVHAIVSSKDDWDRYEGLQWQAADEYARTHPEDPDAAEIKARINKTKAAYLRWGRDTLGWAIYVFRA